MTLPFDTNTIDPAAPLDDLAPLDALVGAARVVGIGENAHHIDEFYQVRHRLLRYLVERHGFTVLAFEAPYATGLATDAWVRGGPGNVEDAVDGAGMLADNVPMRDLLTWMREHSRTAATPLRFTGTVAGAGGVPTAELAYVAAYLERADLDAHHLAATAVDIASAWHAENPMREVAKRNSADVATRDRFTATLSRLHARFAATSATAAEQATARAHLRAAMHADFFHRDLGGDGLALGTACLDAYMAEVVTDILDAEPAARVVLALHNVHLARVPGAGGPDGRYPAGRHLAEALGDAYVSIALTSNHGELVRGRVDPSRRWGFDFGAEPAPEAVEGSVEAGLAGTASLGFVEARGTSIRMETYFAEVDVARAFDAVGCVSRTTALV